MAGSIRRINEAQLAHAEGQRIDVRPAELDERAADLSALLHSTGTIPALFYTLNAMEPETALTLGQLVRFTSVNLRD